MRRSHWRLLWPAVLNQYPVRISIVIKVAPNPQPMLSGIKIYNDRQAQASRLPPGKAFHPSPVVRAADQPSSGVTEFPLHDDCGNVCWFPLRIPRAHSRLWPDDQVFLGGALLADTRRLRDAHFNSNLGWMEEDSRWTPRQQLPMRKEVDAVVFLPAPAGTCQLLGERREGIPQHRLERVSVSLHR